MNKQGWQGWAGLGWLAHARTCLGTKLVIRWWVWYNREMNNSKPGLYANINARRKAGTSRPKSKSTISPKVWRMMKAKKGGFESR
jgi:hypothetical protein